MQEAGEASSRFHLEGEPGLLRQPDGRGAAEPVAQHTYNTVNSPKQEASCANRGDAAVGPGFSGTVLEVTVLHVIWDALDAALKDTAVEDDRRRSCSWWDSRSGTLGQAGFRTQTVQYQKNLRLRAKMLNSAQTRNLIVCSCFQSGSRWQ